METVSELLSDDSLVMRLAAAFRRAGHDLYLVGGPVRDMYLRRPHVDLDFSTGATPEETLEIVKKLSTTQWLQGMKFGTVGAEIDGVHLEITTFRTERYEVDSRHPRVEFESDVETDLSRRDFTVNAVAMRLPEKTIVDPFGGLDDIKERVLETPIHPDDSFSDDPLRMLRAFRFASQLDFRISQDVLDSVARLKEKLRTVSAERIADELAKLLLGERPGPALEQADATGLTDEFLPELSGLKLEQDPVHRHKDVFHHTLAVLERTEPILQLRLAALLHDVGKPKTRRIGPEGVSFHHHEVVGADMARERLRALRYPNEIVDSVAEMIRLHHRFHTYRLGWSDAAVRRYVRDAGPLLGLLNALVRADCTTRNAEKAKRLAARMDELEDRISELAAREEIDKMRPELDGGQIMAYLGIPPGPLVGQARDFMMELRLDEGLLGEDEAYARLDAWAREHGIEPAGTRVPPKEKKKDA
ncbi:MAG: CCA tRNA nucleotidyltransferase [Actinobacteria bacterium]|nr:CCA tRNA nucleotidyltransferase [Actinomycetota bacterium]